MPADSPRPSCVEKPSAENPSICRDIEHSPARCYRAIAQGIYAPALMQKFPLMLKIIEAPAEIGGIL